MILYFKSFGTGVKLIYLKWTRDNFCPFLWRLISLVVSLICNNLLVNKNSVGKYIYGISSSKVENAFALLSYANEYHCSVMVTTSSYFSTFLIFYSLPECQLGGLIIAKVEPSWLALCMDETSANCNLKMSYY